MWRRLIKQSHERRSSPLIVSVIMQLTLTFGIHSYRMYFSKYSELLHSKVILRNKLEKRGTRDGRQKDKSISWMMGLLVPTFVAFLYRGRREFHCRMDSAQCQIGPHRLEQLTRSDWYPIAIPQSAILLIRLQLFILTCYPGKQSRLPKMIDNQNFDCLSKSQDDGVFLKIYGSMENQVSDSDTISK